MRPRGVVGTLPTLLLFFALVDAAAIAIAVNTTAATPSDPQQPLNDAPKKATAQWPLQRLRLGLAQRLAQRLA